LGRTLNSAQAESVTSICVRCRLVARSERRKGLPVIGSFDLYLGPTAPAGKEKNWLRTVPGKGYFVILRLYGPTEPFLNQFWRPGDLEAMMNL
jgi:hypothetical protein